MSAGRRAPGSPDGADPGAHRHAAGAAERLADALRTQILDGSLAGGERLREQALARAHDAARHTVRAALRALSADGLVRIVPNAGASVVRLEAAEIADLAATRMLLEVGAVRLALERGDGRLPDAVHAAAERFAAVCRAAPDRPAPAGPDARPGWGAIVLEHARLHEALVAAAGSPRLTRAHAALSTELALFLVQGRPHFSPGALADEHLALVAALESEGPDALQAHLAASAAALLGRGPAGG